MKVITQSCWAIVVTLAVTLALPITTLAGGKGNGNGGSGGSGGGGTSGYSVTGLLDAAGAALPGAAEAIVDVTGESGEFWGVQVAGEVDGVAHLWSLDATGSLLAAQALALPADAVTGAYSTALDLNDQEVIVGAFDTGSGLRPVVWEGAGATPIELPVFDGFQGDASAIRVNSHGLVIGQFRSFGNDGYLLNVADIVAWGLRADGSVAGPVLVIEAADVDPQADVNDAGTLVAAVNFAGIECHVGWDGEQLQVGSPAPLIGVMSAEGGGPTEVVLVPAAINQLGDICGRYGAIDGSLRGAFLGLSDGTLRDLAPLASKRWITESGAGFDLTDSVDPDAVKVLGTVDFIDKRTGPAFSDPVVWRGAAVTNVAEDTEAFDPDQEWLALTQINNVGWLAGVVVSKDSNVARPVVLIAQ